MHGDFLLVLYLYTSSMLAIVWNFDFKYVVTFYNWLLNIELSTFCIKTAPSASRKISICLTFTLNCQLDWENLYPDCWLSYCAYLAKRSTQVAVIPSVEKSLLKPGSLFIAGYVDGVINVDMKVPGSKSSPKSLQRWRNCNR